MIRRIMWEDLDFPRAPLRFYSTCGTPQTSWVRVGMPHIPQTVINGVFYLYANEEDARAGRDPGGTGFIVDYGDGYFGRRHSVYYGVTNWHVMRDFPVIRLNKKDGGTAVIDLGPDQWEFLPGKYDVAVVPLTLDNKIHDVSAVEIGLFAEDPAELKRRHRMGAGLGDDIGIGEDVFMIGLFADHGGTKTNIPSARFGNISMMPNQNATITQTTGYDGVSFIVDMHSRSGFSGSPVFVYRTFGSDFTEKWGEPFDAIDMDLDNVEVRPAGRGTMGSEPLRGKARGSHGRIKVKYLFKLLGIHWGHFEEKWKWHDSRRAPDSNRKDKPDLVASESHVKVHSAMNLVIPAWQIKEVLDMPKLKEPRDLEIAAAKRKKDLFSGSVVADSAPKEPSDENPNHKEDFTSLLNAAAQLPKRDEQT